MNPGDLVISHKTNVILEDIRIHNNEKNIFFSWIENESKRSRLDCEYGPFIIIANMTMLANNFSKLPISITYLLSPRDIGWDYADHLDVL